VVRVCGAVDSRYPAQRRILPGTIERRWRKRAVGMVRQHAHEHGELVSGRAAGSGPQGPTELPKRSWWAVLKRTVREFGKDNLTDWAAALTYYSVLSISPQ
jgi:hypothetical protein